MGDKHLSPMTRSMNIWDNEDWRYSPEKMTLREQVISILLNRFGTELNSDGSPVYSNQSIFECAHDWVSQGNARADGIVAYYKAYYTKS